MCQTYITVYANKNSLKLDLNLQPFCLLSDKLGEHNKILLHNKIHPIVGPITKIENC